MESITIQAEPRTVVRKRVQALRRSGLLPGVMYGTGSEPIAIQMNAHGIGLILNRLHGTVLLDVIVDGTTHKAVVRDLQRDYVRGDLLHVDFLKVAMDQTIVTTVSVHLVGDAPILAQAGVVVGADGVFMEVHENPDKALSDGPNSLPLASADKLLSKLKKLHQVTHVA